MKQLLPILLCYVLMTSQVFAISGGPVFGSGVLNPVGTYSGVIQGVTQGSTTTPFTGNINTDLNGSNQPSTALGLFTISVPSTSVATGAFALFADGDVFTGNFDASIDIDSNKLAGIAFGYEFQQTTVVFTDGTTAAISTETAYASGQITGQVSGSRGGTSSARIRGKAYLNVVRLNATVDTTTGKRPSTPLNCTVSGFRQSTTASTISALPSIGITGSNR